jgi:predicted  nucleic acid-binding Zn-ribbon protein
MSPSTEIPSVSMANTKKDLLDAYQAAKDRAEALGKELLDAEKARKRMEKLVKSQADQITDLSRRHEQAYEKVQDIANRAVASARRDDMSVYRQAHGSQARPESGGEA